MGAKLQVLYSWIHLSDIHFGAGDASTKWDRETVLRKLSEDAIQLVEKVGRVDAILISGDIAHSGGKAQYETAKQALNKLTQGLQLTLTDVHAVPGNHDVDRTAGNTNGRRLIAEIRGTGHIDQALSQKSDHRLLERRLREYLTFAKELAPHPSDLFWSTTIATPQLQLRIIGLNTALVARDNEDRGHLYVGRQQLERGLQDKESGDLIIVMGHHPTDWLGDGKELGTRIQNEADVHLSGHIHDATSEDARSGAGDAIVRVGAGALHEPQTSGEPAFRYNLAQIVRRNNNLSLRVYHRRYEGREFLRDVNILPPGERFAVHKLVKARPRAIAGPTQKALTGGVTLSDYLSALHATASRVRLPGSDQDRPLDNVWVRLNLSDETVSPPQRRSDLEAETEGRNPVWRRPPTTLDATSLLDLAPRSLVVGPAGTGKSTLLRFLAGHAARRRENEPAARIPVWFRKLPQPVDCEGPALLDELTRSALTNAGCDAGRGEAYEAIRQALAEKKAYVLIDGVEETDTINQERADEWLTHLGDRVVLASRPLLAERAWKSVRRVALLGIPSVFAERMVRTYFSDAEWVPELIATLRALPDGQRWLETPMLLGLAATLRSRGGEMPRSAIELYEKAISVFIEDNDRIPRTRRQDLRQHIAELAFRCLAADQGSCQVWFDRSEISGDSKEAMASTGLFDAASGSLVRFTHLSLGEFLAAGSGKFDPERAIDMLASPGGAENASLEVLPMALALRAPAALEMALREAGARDKSDHRILRNLLCSIGFGGPSVSKFCQQNGRAVLRLIADRLANPAGRFGDDERELMSMAWRAFVILRDYVTADEARACLGELLDLRGEVGNEANVALCGFGEPPVRRVSHWWVTIDRQAQALVQYGYGVEDIRRITRGGEGYDRTIALRALGKSNRHSPRIRLLLSDPDRHLRMDAARFLADDDGGPAFRELLTDEDASLRGLAIHCLSSAPGPRGVHVERLLGALKLDPSDRVRAAAAVALGKHPECLSLLRTELHRLVDLPRFDSRLRHEAMVLLANDSASETTIQRYLARPKRGWLHEAELLGALANARPEWRALLLERLGASDVSPCEVQAFASDASEVERLCRLLVHANPGVVVAATESLVGQPNVRGALQPLLNHENARIRAVTVSALASDRGSWPSLRPFIDDQDEEVRSAAILALQEDPEAIDAIAHRLEDCKQRVRTRAINALGNWRVGKRAVRDYFAQTAGRPGTEWRNRDHDVLSHDALRALALEQFADLPDSAEAVRHASKSDPHAAVRTAALRQLCRDSSTRAQLVGFIDDPVDDLRRAALELLTDQPAVETRLLEVLEEDLWALRLMSFRLLVECEDGRQALRDMLCSPDTDAGERATVVQPLMHDPDSRRMLLTLLIDPDDQAHRVAQGLLSDDAEARLIVREKATDRRWLQSLSHWSGHPVQTMLANDPDAWPILRAHLRSKEPLLVRIVAPLLSHDEEAWSDLRSLLDDDDLRDAGLSGLGRDELSRPQLVQALQSDDFHTRLTAARALREVPEARTRFVPLLEDSDRSIREIAIDVLSNEPSTDIRQAFADRLPREPEDKLRRVLLLAVQDDSSARQLLRDRLHGDYSREVRKEAAKALRGSRRAWAVPLAQLPTLLDVSRHLRDGAGHSELGDRLQAFVQQPGPLDLHTDPQLGELVIGWCLARLAWASSDGTMSRGAMLGEVEREVQSLMGETLLVRVAMDASECPNERFFHPSHNVIEAWSVATHLVAPKQTAIVLACADTDFEDLSPPALAPGQVLWGPTLYGFRLREH